MSVFASLIKSWRLAWQWAPWQFLLVVILSLLQALVPVLQMQTVGYLVSGIEQRSNVVIPAVLVATVAGGSFSLGALHAQASNLLSFTMQRHAISCVLDRAAHMPATELSQEQGSLAIQGARNAQDAAFAEASGGLACACTLVTMSTLFAGLWGYSRSAAVFVLLALVPGIVSFFMISKHYKVFLNDLIENQRYANYYTEQLVYQKPAFELRSLGASPLVSSWADARQGVILNCRRSYIARLSRNEVLNGVITTCLLCGALLCIASDAGSTGVAAALVGIIGGINATRGAGYTVGNLFIDRASLEQYCDFIEGAKEVPGPRAGDSAAPATCRSVESLNISGLVVRYGNSVKAISDVSLEFRRGEPVAIVGANGAGKTTLINALLGTVDVADGSLSYAGRDGHAHRGVAAPGMIGVVAQDFVKFKLTIRQFIMLGVGGSRTDEEMWGALSDACAADFVARTPAGLDSQLGQQWGGVGLSGGQWQRLALARLYLCDSPVWLLDEPTSALDAETERLVIRKLLERSREKICLLTTHRVAALRAVSSIVVLAEGSVVDTGSFDVLARRDGPFADLFFEEMRERSREDKP